jgi:hypothetical protein
MVFSLDCRLCAGSFLRARLPGVDLIEASLGGVFRRVYGGIKPT